MLRFYIPEKANDAASKTEAIKEQIEAFFQMEALKDLLKILEVDIDTLGKVYNGRVKANGAIIETQDVASHKELEGKRAILLPIFRELGFIDINKPLNMNSSHIIILGGSLSACYDRTRCAKKWLNDKTCFVDGLACYRPINPIERSSNTDFFCDTEFGAMSESFLKVFNLNRNGAIEEFKGNRNLNSISNIRIYNKSGDDRKYRIFAGPSTVPELRRPDTGDTLKFYIEENETITSEDNFLFVTNNRYCNRQFLQLAYWMKEVGCPAKLDVIGCSPKERIASVDRYDPNQYLQDLIGIIDWAFRFRE